MGEVCDWCGGVEDVRGNADVGMTCRACRGDCAGCGRPDCSHLVRLLAEFD